MEFSGKVVAITGAGSGIGAALARAIAKEGARLSIIDRNPEAAQAVAAEVSGVAFSCDVTDETSLRSAISETEAQLGPIDCFVSNAGLGRGQPDHAASASNDDWQLNWNVHVMAHVYAARVLLPAMIERGAGYFVNTASAAGLLNQIGDAAYSATKHAAVSFAESLAITHGDEGIGVSVVCPQYVATPLVGVGEEEAAAHETLLTADDVAHAIIDGVRAERFRILPHPQVSEYTELRAADPDKWVKGMRKLRSIANAKFGTPGPQHFYKLV